MVSSEKYAQGDGMKRKRGRPRKTPGEPVEHRLTPKMRAAITAIVEGGKTLQDAAAEAGLTVSAIYKGMKTAPVREFYLEELHLLRTCAKAAAAHVLIKEMTGPNAAARVAAAKAILDDEAGRAGGAPGQSAPNFIIVIGDQRAQPQAAIDGRPPTIPAAENHARILDTSLLRDRPDWSEPSRDGPAQVQGRAFNEIEFDRRGRGY
jgi:hypothetical protein